MHLSADKTRAILELEGTFDAAGVEDLILRLSAMRSAMEPPIPNTPPPASSEEDAAASRAKGDPCVQVAVMRGGMTRFWVRHGGLGWFAFNLPVERANLLANYILETTNPGGHGMDLSSVRRRESDLTH
jgi:hypothetical protein